jgi:hypothetical protein
MACRNARLEVLRIKLNVLMHQMFMILCHDLVGEIRLSALVAELRHLRLLDGYEYTSLSRFFSPGIFGH